MKMRWFHGLLRLFPDASRSDRHQEMADALADTEMSKTWMFRESRALVWAALVAWRLHLGTAEGVRRSVHVGAALWFGFLVGVGPWGRFGGSLGDHPFQLGRNAHPAHFALAGLLLIAALFALRWGRLPAVLIGIIAIAVAANVNRVGQWQLGRSLVYEVQWLGAAFGLVVLSWRRRGAGPAVMATLVSIATGLLVAVRLGVSTTYGITISRLPDEVWLTNSGRYLQLIPVVLIVLVAALPWFFPGGVAVLAPALVHLMFLDPWPAIALVAYFAAAVAIRLALRSTQISITFHQRN